MEWKFCRKALNEEFYSTDISGVNGVEGIVPANKSKTSGTNHKSILKLHEDFSMLDENGDTLIFLILLDEHIRRCNLIFQTSCDVREDVGPTLSVLLHLDLI